MILRRTTWTLKTTCIVTLLALGLTAGSVSAAKLKTTRNWRPDGNGQYVHKRTGRVISDAQYTELLAQEVRQRVGARTRGLPAYCAFPDN